MFEGMDSLPYNSHTGKPGNGPTDKDFALKTSNRTTLVD